MAKIHVSGLEVTQIDCSFTHDKPVTSPLPRPLGYVRSVEHGGHVILQSRQITLSSPKIVSRNRFTG
ncbi:hypothetical protein TNCV_1542341 [Trichonephila clavipes]|nr:hypothetical protein TNCV_1542341 [Trichonephila clavipes]